MAVLVDVGDQQIAKNVAVAVSPVDVGRRFQIAIHRHMHCDVVGKARTEGHFQDRQSLHQDAAKFVVESVGRSDLCHGAAGGEPVVPVSGPDLEVSPVTRESVVVVVDQQAYRCVVLGLALLVIVVRWQRDGQSSLDQQLDLLVNRQCGFGHSGDTSQ